MQLEMQSRLLLERRQIPQSQYPLPAEIRRYIRDFKRSNNQRINRLDDDSDFLDAQIESAMGGISSDHPLRQSRALLTASLMSNCITEPACVEAFKHLLNKDKRTFVATYDLFFGAAQGIDELIMGLCKQQDPSLFDQILAKKVDEGCQVMPQIDLIEASNQYLAMNTIASRAALVLHDTITGADVVRLAIVQAKLAFLNNRMQKRSKPSFFGRQKSLEDILIPELTLAGAEESLAAYERIYRITEGL